MTARTRLAARAVALHCPGSPADRRQVLEMLGLVAPGGRQVLPRPRPASSARATPPPRRHGTITGYHRHRKAQERACDACRAAWADYQRAQRRKAGVQPRGTKPITHGTVAGYKLHLKRGIVPCQPCRDAMAQDRRRYRARQGARRAA